MNGSPFVFMASKAPPDRLSSTLLPWLTRSAKSKNEVNVPPPRVFYDRVDTRLADPFDCSQPKSDATFEGA